MHISLQLVTDQRYTDAMSTSWDWKQQNQDTLHGYINILLQQQNINRLAWWIKADSQPAGFFNIVKNKDHTEHATGTFIHKPYRSTDVHKQVKHAAIKAFQTMQLPLISSIQDSNIRSLKATRKLVHANPKLEWEQHANRNAYIYILTDYTPANPNLQLVKFILEHEHQIRSLQQP